jgi:hypothetical protein
MTTSRRRSRASARHVDGTDRKRSCVRSSQPQAWWWANRSQSPTGSSGAGGSPPLPDPVPGPGVCVIDQALTNIKNHGTNHAGSVPRGRIGQFSRRCQPMAVRWRHVPRLLVPWFRAFCGRPQRADPHPLPRRRRIPPTPRTRRVPTPRHRLGRRRRSRTTHRPHPGRLIPPVPGRDQTAPRPPGEQPPESRPASAPIPASIPASIPAPAPALPRQSIPRRSLRPQRL